MGLNFILKTAIPHTKAWKADFQDAARDMFAADCVVIDRSYLASQRDPAALELGDHVNVRLSGNQVLVYKDICLVAEIVKPSLDLIENLNSCYGILSGQVDDTNEMAKVVSVRVGRREKK